MLQIICPLFAFISQIMPVIPSQDKRIFSIYFSQIGIIYAWNQGLRESKCPRDMQQKIESITLSVKSEFYPSVKIKIVVHR